MSGPTCAVCEAPAVVRFNERDDSREDGIGWGQQYGCAEHREVLTQRFGIDWMITELTSAPATLLEGGDGR